jgi:hypothetical protein
MRRKWLRTRWSSMTGYRRERGLTFDYNLVGAADGAGGADRLALRAPVAGDTGNDLRDAVHKLNTVTTANTDT